MAENDFQYGGWNYYTLQCGRWLWDDMPLNSPKRPPYWSSTSGFDFDHITAVDMSFCTSLRNFIQIGTPPQKKMTACRFSSAILDFRGPIMGWCHHQLGKDQDSNHRCNCTTRLYSPSWWKQCGGSRYLYISWLTTSQLRWKRA